MLYRINEDGEREKFCPRCKEWWPADKEFFYSNGHRGLHSLCKACYIENRWPNGRSKEQQLVLQSTLK